MRRITKAVIQFISLVPKGANKMKAVYKDDGSFEVQGITKSTGEGYLTSVVYAPEHRDSQGDIASAEVIKDMAHQASRKGNPEIDIRHDGKPVGRDRAYVAESFIIGKGDVRFEDWKDTEGNPVDLEGAWATVIKIEDPELRALYEKGEFAAVSMGGTATVESDDASIKEFVDSYLSKHPTLNPSQEDDEMKPEDLKKAMEEALQPITKTVGDLTAKVEKLEKGDEKPEPKEPEKKTEETEDPNAPVFKGDLEDEDALVEFERVTSVYNLRKEADLKTPKGIRAYKEALKLLKEEWEEANGMEWPKAEPKAKKNLRKSNQPTGESDSAPSYGSNVKSKDAELLKAGAELFAKSKKDN